MESELIQVDSSAGFPERRKICLELPQGVNTEIIYTAYSDRHFIVISQVNKFGSLLSASCERVSDETKIYHVHNILGRRDDALLNIYARNIIENIAKTSEKPLVLAICLREEGRSTSVFQGVMNALIEMHCW